MHGGVGAKYQGKIGTLTMAPDSDAEVKLRWDDGSESGYVKAVRVHPLTSAEEAQRDGTVLCSGGRHALLKGANVAQPSYTGGTAGCDTCSKTIATHDAYSCRECESDLCVDCYRAKGGRVPGGGCGGGGVSSSGGAEMCSGYSG